MTFDQHFDLKNNKIDVLLIGEILVDIIRDSLNSVEYRLFGGSPGNIAVNLNNLGMKVKLYASIGADDFGDFLIKKLHEKQIENVINVTNGKTSYVELNKNIGTPTPRFYRYSDYMIPFSNDLINDLSLSKILHFSYWPLSMEPGFETVLKSILDARNKGVMIGFDPNYHPDLDDDKKSGITRIKAILPLIDIIKPSYDDSLRIFGQHTVDEFLDIYESYGISLIIITLGEKGLIARFQGETIALPSKATEVVDATGAGDAFWSGLYAGLASNKSIMDSMKIGLLCSAYCLKVVGADGLLPNLEKLVENLN